ncbi:hypothetical protein [Alkanindiges illinoisensis]|uniref:Uncharacterized protein n=1 Tax=Alkanindiges illinoisensis TaxID=197183 RepID=A0A4Y7X8T8_9GAMM|nr:hypothetical protein [Alkanindiges illinoisensis]TEU23357.1 hypothetical protein E2B99_13660 [Alkanindiges illinoisensis]
MADDKTTDWKKIELDYRAGVKSLRQIASENGISDTAIRKRAKKDEWTRDLSARIQAKADDLVRKDQVRAEVRTRTTVSEREIVESNAQAIATIQLNHRKDIQRSRNIAMNLMAELEQQSGLDNADLLEQLGDLMRNEDDKGQDKLNDLYCKIISLPGRAKTMKDLGESLRVLIGLERQAFNMDSANINDSVAGGTGKQMSDAERAVRLSRLLQSNPDAYQALLALRNGGSNG